MQSITFAIIKIYEDIFKLFKIFFKAMPFNIALHFLLFSIISNSTVHVFKPDC